MARIRQVPDRYREFVQTVRDAAWEHRLDHTLLERFTDLGLPCRGGPDGPRYDRLDLANASLALRLPSARSMAMRGWANTLRATAGSAATTFEVEIRPRCPAPGHPGECAYEASAALRAQPGFTESPDGHRYLVRDRIVAPDTDVPQEVRDLAALVSPLHYHLLPEELRGDIGFARETNLADCALAVALLVAEATLRGITARPSFGFLLAVPYSIEHAWTEVEFDGRQVSLDPHLLNLLTSWDLLERDQWPSHQPISACTWRLGGHKAHPVLHHGAGSMLSLATVIKVDMAA
ncbi:transglutaminase domain-containing protein [Streptomyces hainanensis]|uniref:Uncharacterized protein n=1 Tax=Streptomyces hainanensis TaxID=402648 RepID=A0A4R4TMA5_9ACTN|nr:transglutaminase domain-containing protein [Streptomyces hainanensis]TDC79218.1 hypothetical protein E1283_03290 [Streptomyces hainanensis]